MDAEPLSFVLNSFSFVNQMALAKLMGGTQRCNTHPEKKEKCVAEALERSLAAATPEQRERFKIAPHGYSATNLWSQLGIQYV
jgi:hypothetical protein